VEGCSSGRKVVNEVKRGGVGRKGGPKRMSYHPRAVLREREHAAGLAIMSAGDASMEYMADIPSAETPSCTTTFPCPISLPSTVPSAFKPKPMSIDTPTSPPVQVQLANPISHSRRQTVLALFRLLGTDNPPDFASVDVRVPRSKRGGEPVERRTVGCKEVLLPREQILRVTKRAEIVGRLIWMVGLVDFKVVMARSDGRLVIATAGIDEVAVLEEEIVAV